MPVKFIIYFFAFFSCCRTKYCTHLSRRLIPKCKISSTRRHGGSSLVWSSSPRRYVCSSHFSISISHTLAELDKSFCNASQRLHLDKQVLRRSAWSSLLWWQRIHRRA